MKEYRIRCKYDGIETGIIVHGGVAAVAEYLAQELTFVDDLVSIEVTEVTR